MKKVIKNILLVICRSITNTLKKLTSFAYRLLFWVEWSIDEPEYFEHEIDYYYLAEHRNSPHWLERGVYNMLALNMFESPRVIELCCGDGFNSYYFYSALAEHIYACDYCKSAIKQAKKKYRRYNVQYDVCDITSEFHEKINANARNVTNVIWDTAILYFSHEEVNAILKKVKGILAQNQGVLSGHTVVDELMDENFYQHKIRITSKEELRDILKPHFRNVYVWETIYKERHNLYFFASEGDIPFS